MNRGLYLSTQERKFFNTLPGWAKPLVTYLSIQQPGQYPDSYEMYMVPLPDDTKHDRSDTIMLQGWNAADIKHNLEHYKETFEEHDERW